MSTFLDDETGNLITGELALQVTRIYERAQHETLALLESRPTEKGVVPVREWMSATQLAEYWQLYNDKNEPTTAGILKGQSGLRISSRFRTLTWATCSDSTELRSTHGQRKKPKEDDFKTKSGA